MSLNNLQAVFQQMQEISDRGRHLESLVRDAEEKFLFHFDRNQKLAALFLALQSKETVDRKMWKLIRDSLFWEVEVPLYDEAKFKENFRMSRKLFKELVNSVKILEKKDTVFRDCIPLDKRVAVSIYYLASSAECRTVSNLFGIGRSTVREIALEFCEAVVETHKRDGFSYYPPTEETIKEVVDGFEQRWGFPQVYGAVDGCHIEVSPCKDEATDYHNYKGWYSIVLLAAVDYRYRFTYINVGSPGKNNDSCIFERSKLKSEHENNELFYKCSRVIDGVSVPVGLLGDSAFRLRSKTLKPYPGVKLSPTKKNFNFKLSRSRRVVENAFGHLKGRFRRIGRGLEMVPKNASLVIKTCCILHNFLNNRNDAFTFNIDDEQSNFTCNQPAHITLQGEDNLTATKIRNTLAHYLYSGRRPNDGIATAEDDGGEGPCATDAVSGSSM